MTLAAVLITAISVSALAWVFACLTWRRALARNTVVLLVASLITLTTLYVPIAVVVTMAIVFATVLLGLAGRHRPH